MKAKFELGQVVRANDGQCTGSVTGIWLAVSDETQYLVVWWNGGERHCQWLRERELVAR